MRFKNALIVAAVLAYSSIGVQAQTDIRKVNFNNFTYKPYCTGDETGDASYTITVKKGKFENVILKNGVYETKDDAYPDYFEVDKITYGDLDGDKKDEAVIRTLCNTGGTGQFSEGFVYTMTRSGKPKLLTRFAGGDRGFGGLQSAKIQNGFLLVERNDGEANCCADFTLTTRYRWNKSKLVAVGKPARRKIHLPK